MRSFTIATIFALASSQTCWGQVVKAGERFQETRTPERVTSGRVAVIDANFNLKSEWRDLRSAGSPARASWQMAFDTMGFDTVTNQSYSGIYGQSPGFWRWSNVFRNPYICNDITGLAPGTNGLSATRFTTDIVWNPGGTYERSGSGRLAIAVFCATGFGSNPAGISWTGALGPLIGSGFYGVVIDFGVQQHGWRTYDANLTGTGFSIPLPSTATTANPASVVMVIGTLNGTNFSLCPPTFAMQPTLDTMANADDPNYPGLNPSRSGILQWDDDGGSIMQAVSNGVHDNTVSTASQSVPFSELYIYDFSESNLGYPQPAMGLFVNTAAPRVIGEVVSADEVPPMLGLTFVATNSAGNPETTAEDSVLSVNASPSADGGYSVTRPTLEGQNGPASFASAEVTSPGYLIDVVGPFDLSSDFQIPTASLVLGDVDGDNEIGPGDFEAVVSGFGSVYGNFAWNSLADLDRDGEIGPGDFEVVVRNFGISGENLLP